MPVYRVDSHASKLIVRARSSIHDTETIWRGIEGRIEADPVTLEQSGARASFTVDMRAFDAGDWLKNRALAKTLGADRDPHAAFELTGLGDVERAAAGQFAAKASGVLRWRGREVPLVIAGRGAMDEQHIDATGSFDLDIRVLGIAPPRFLVFKVEDEVTVQVIVRARV